MSKPSKKGSHDRQTSSSLKEHKQRGKTFSPPLTQIPVTPIHWNRDLLPEMLWIDSLLDAYGWQRVGPLFHQTLELLDTYVPKV
jgi:hypothetical protein